MYEEIGLYVPNRNRRKMPAANRKVLWFVSIIVILLLASAGIGAIYVRTVALREEIRVACVNGNDLPFMDQVQMRRICREFTPHPVPKTRGGKTYFL